MRTPHSHSQYWAALGALAKIYRDQITSVMPHEGEKGRIIEEIIKDAVTKVLPRKFSIGTGVLIANDGRTSNQTDVVIYDHFTNAPLLSEFSAHIFPIEIVYATIEVKAQIDQTQLVDSLQKIATIRQMADQKRYVVQELVDRPDGNKVFEAKHVVSRTPPRNYIAAFGSDRLRQDPSDLTAAIAEACVAAKSHLHGLCLLDRDEFFVQRPYTDPAEITHHSENGFFSFLLSVLRHQQNFHMMPIDIDAYLEDGASPSVLSDLD